MFQPEHFCTGNCVRIDMYVLFFVNETIQSGYEGEDDEAQKEAKTQEDLKNDQFGGGIEGETAQRFTPECGGLIPANQKARYPASGCRCDRVVQEIRARLPDADQSSAAEDDGRRDEGREETVCRVNLGRRARASRPRPHKLIAHATYFNFVAVTSI
jgi:hypothetical protein